MTHPKTITVGELRSLMLDELNALPDNAEVYFGCGDLSFNRVKNRGSADGPGLIQIDFRELYEVTYDPDAPASS